MIALADSARQRDEIFRFRYEVIAREQGLCDDPSVNHDSCTIVDPADQTGILLAAWDGGVLTGTVRLNLLRDGPAEPFSTLLGLTGLPANERDLISVTSRLMVRHRWRGTPLGVRLAQAVVRYYVAAGLAWDYILVRLGMVRFFRRLGYRQIAREIDFPGVGRLIPLRLNLDLAYLRGARSLLAPVFGSQDTLEGRNSLANATTSSP